MYVPPYRRGGCMLKVSELAIPSRVVAPCVASCAVDRPAVTICRAGCSTASPVSRGEPRCARSLRDPGDRRERRASRTLGLALQMEAEQGDSQSRRPGTSDTTSVIRRE